MGPASPCLQASAACKRPHMCTYCGVPDHALYECELRLARFPQVEAYVDAQRKAYFASQDDAGEDRRENEPGPSATGARGSQDPPRQGEAEQQPE
eukprot:10005144-Alexandrium_andersonii.AAC.1